jgi:hypothetical protein
MVYDGYHGGFVPFEAASFDTSLAPEAVVYLPLAILEEQRAAAEAEERRRLVADARRARPPCDGRTHRVQTVTRAADGLLAFCASCAEGLAVAALTSPALIDALVARPTDPRAQARRRRELERRLQARRHERDLAAGASGPARSAAGSAACSRPATARSASAGRARRVFPSPVSTGTGRSRRCPRAARPRSSPGSTRPSRSAPRPTSSRPGSLSHRHHSREPLASARGMRSQHPGARSRLWT